MIQIKLLPEDIIENIESGNVGIDWDLLCKTYKLPENFIEKYIVYLINVKSFIENQELSLDLIDRYFKFFNFLIYDQLTEEIILNNFDKVNWLDISRYTPLSEEFIDKYSRFLSWGIMCCSQRLGEGLIEQHLGNIDWIGISKNQKLSEGFIEKYSRRVHWDYIFRYQELSEGFIRRNFHSGIWSYIGNYQRLSEEFRREHEVIVSPTCWLYWGKEEKRDYIRNNTGYEIVGDKVIAYKAVRKGGHSVYNLQYKYEVGGVYESNADCNCDIENSFGLSGWDIDGARKYFSSGRIFKIEIDLEDIGCIVNISKKIRARKIRVLSEVR